MRELGKPRSREGNRGTPAAGTSSSFLAVMACDEESHPALELTPGERFPAASDHQQPAPGWRGLRKRNRGNSECGLRAAGRGVACVLLSAVT